jgi:hypothetical protein
MKHDLAHNNPRLWMRDANGRATAIRRLQSTLLGLNWPLILIVLTGRWL